MQFNGAYIKGVKADIAKREITLSFVIDMNKTTLPIAQDLSVYADGRHGSVDLTVLPRQMPLLDDMVRSLKNLGLESVEMSVEKEG